MARTPAFRKIHEDLPRQGPGSDETTQKLLDIADPTHRLGSAIDMGCGPGRATLLLTSQGFHVIAIDMHDPFLEQLRKDAVSQDLTNNIDIRHMSMSDVTYPDNSFNLIWSEGTAYIISWEKALTEWRRLLKPGGKLVVTDSFWLTDNRSPEAVAFWAADPLMMTVEIAKDTVEKAGYSVEYTYLQPDTDWFDEYYSPLEQKIATLSMGADEDVQEAIAATAQEINVRRKYGDEFGHVGFVLGLA